MYDDELNKLDDCWEELIRLLGMDTYLLGRAIRAARSLCQHGESTKVISLAQARLGSPKYAAVLSKYNLKGVTKITVRD